MKRILPILLLAGCLDREEEITIRPDGSADVTITYKGDPGDFDAYLLFPSSGWNVTKGRDGKQIVWKATKTFRDLNEYPVSFAAADFPNRDRCFRYETKLRTKKSGNATIYEFERIYPRFDAREFVAIDDAVYQTKEAETLLKKLHEGGIKKLTDGEKTRLYEIVAGAELEKRMTVASRAVAGYPWERRVEMLRKIHDVYREALSGKEVGRMFDRLFELPESEQQKFAADFYRDLRKKTIAAVGDKTFEAAYDAEEAAYRAGTALADDRIKLTVRLPGEIVAGNAQSEGGVAKWDIDAKELFQGPVTLRAVSIEKR